MTTNAQALKRAKKAQRADERGVPGWYVRNAFTGIAVDGPYEDPEPARLAKAELEPPTMVVAYLDPTGPEAKQPEVVA